MFGIKDCGFKIRDSDVVGMKYRGIKITKSRIMWLEYKIVGSRSGIVVGIKDRRIEIRDYVAGIKDCGPGWDQ